MRARMHGDRVMGIVNDSGRAMRRRVTHDGLNQGRNLGAPLPGIGTGVNGEELDGREHVASFRLGDHFEYGTDIKDSMFRVFRKPKRTADHLENLPQNVTAREIQGRNQSHWQHSGPAAPELIAAFPTDEGQRYETLANDSGFHVLRLHHTRTHDHSHAALVDMNRRSREFWNKQ